MRNLVRTLSLVLGLTLIAAQARAAVIPDLSGERGSSTFGLGLFTDSSNTSNFELELLGPAQGNLRLTFATPGAFGLAALAPSGTISGPGGDVMTGPLMSGGVLTFASALLQSAGSYVISISASADPSTVGQLKTYEFGLAVTPIPAAVLLLAPALAGLGVVGVRRRRAAS